MNLSQIRQSTVALIVAALVMVLVGRYSENSGFEWAGYILGFVAVINGLIQANSSSRSSDAEKQEDV